MIVFVNQMLLMQAGDVERNPGPGKRGRIFGYWRSIQYIWRALSVHVNYCVYQYRIGNIRLSELVGLLHSQ